MAILESLPKVEDKLVFHFPYAITKYVNELYVEIFSKHVWRPVQTYRAI